MTLTQFRQGLDAWGSEIAAWPATEAAAARALLAGDGDARQALDAARRLDAALRRDAGTGGRDDAAGARIRVRLAARPLPPQRRPRFVWWPAALLDRDFAPAWPRIAGLAMAGCLGILIGLFGVNIIPSDSAASVRGASMTAEADLGALVFEPEPLTGARP